MVFKNLCVLLLWMKVALALEGLQKLLVLIMPQMFVLRRPCSREKGITWPPFPGIALWEFLLHGILINALYFMFCSMTHHNTVCAFVGKLSAGIVLSECVEKDRSRHSHCPAAL